jgi:hypothetical protein
VGELGIGHLARAARVAEDRVGEAVAAHLLASSDQGFDEGSAVLFRVGFLVAGGHAVQPVAVYPGMMGV